MLAAFGRLRGVSSCSTTISVVLDLLYVSVSSLHQAKNENSRRLNHSFSPLQILSFQRQGKQHPPRARGKREDALWAYVKCDYFVTICCRCCCCCCCSCRFCYFCGGVFINSDHSKKKQTEVATDRQTQRPRI